MQETKALEWTVLTYSHWMITSLCKMGIIPALLSWGGVGGSGFGFFKIIFLDSFTM
jgi:hypothetical protein